jgi:hypothetical protein
MSEQIVLSVGKEVLSLCSKCKLTLAHIIASMKSPTVVDKVVCKTCKGTHSFKDPSSKAPKKSVNRLISQHKSPSSKSKKSSETQQALWERMMNGAKAQFLDYAISTEFKSGDIIKHPSFGDGFVERSIDQNKIEVIFQAETKILLHNKKS